MKIGLQKYEYEKSFVQSGGEWVTIKTYPLTGRSLAKANRDIDAEIKGEARAHGYMPRPRRGQGTLFRLVALSDDGDIVRVWQTGDAFGLETGPDSACGWEGWGKAAKELMALAERHIEYGRRQPSIS